MLIKAADLQPRGHEFEPCLQKKERNKGSQMGLTKKSSRIIVNKNIDFKIEGFQKSRVLYIFKRGIVLHPFFNGFSVFPTLSFFKNFWFCVKYTRKKQVGFRLYSCPI